MIFKLLCTSPNPIEAYSTTFWTGLRERTAPITIMAPEATCTLVPSERDRTLIAAEAMATAKTTDSVTEASPVEEENRLLSRSKSRPQCVYQLTGEIGRLWVWAPATAHINEVEPRELGSRWACEELKARQFTFLTIK